MRFGNIFCLLYLAGMHGLTSSAREYTFHNTNASWLEANTTCYSTGGTLAVARNDEDTQLIQQVIQDTTAEAGEGHNTSDVWIGGYLQYPGDIGLTSGHCPIIRPMTPDIYLSSSTCDTVLPVICLLENGSYTTDSGANHQVNWHEYRQDCFNKHNVTGSVDDFSLDEAERFLDGNTAQYWLIFSTWRWATIRGEEIAHQPANWSEGEPNEGVQRCLSMSVASGMWADDLCATEKTFVCLHGDDDDDHASGMMSTSSSGTGKVGIIVGCVASLVVLAVAISVAIFIYVRVFRQKKASSKDDDAYIYYTSVSEDHENKSSPDVNAHNTITADTDTSLKPKYASVADDKLSDGTADDKLSNGTADDSGGSDVLPEYTTRDESSSQKHPGVNQPDRTGTSNAAIAPQVPAAVPVYAVPDKKRGKDKYKHEAYEQQQPNTDNANASHAPQPCDDSVGDDDDPVMDSNVFYGIS